MTLTRPDAILRRIRNCSRHYGKRLLDALSWLSETWKISITAKNETTVDAFEYVYTCRWCARERVLSDCQHIQREASVVRSTVVGNSRASESGTGLKVQALRFSFLWK